MKIRRLLAVSLFLFVVLGSSAMLAARTPVAAQTYSTPTAGPDGRILYIVQPGDNCISISLANNITLEQLRALNSNLDENCSLTVGQELLLGLGGPALASPTPGPLPTSTPPPPTPTPFTGTTEICVLVYEDQNGDALHQETEPGIENGAVSVSNSAGTFSQSKTTTSAPDPDTGLAASVCFEDVPEGAYSISVGVPDNFNPTMTLTYALDVKAGDRAAVAFGAQSKAQTVQDTGTQPGTGMSNLLGILGGFFLLAGLGLGWYAIRLRRPAGKFAGGSQNK